VKEKTALVLSAGGMFGAYQAGAWRAINERFEPDLVVGASVGALNGWPIAGGSSPEEMIERWRDPALRQVLTRRGNRSYRFDPVPLREHARRIHEQFTPRVRFGLVVVKLQGFGNCLVEHPNVTVDHLQATASIPVCLPAVRINGCRYLDGGLIEKTPIWAAVEMGARKIVAVDCLRVSDFWVNVGMSAFRKLKRKRRIPEDVEITMIAPEAALGAWEDAVFWKRENVERWIELGQRDAARVLNKSFR